MQASIFQITTPVESGKKKGRSTEQGSYTTAQGDIITGLYPIELAHLRHIPPTAENAISKKELARLVYGDSAPPKVLSHRTNMYIAILRGKLREWGYNIIHTVDDGKSRKGGYYLQKLTEFRLSTGNQAEVVAKGALAQILQRLYPFGPANLAPYSELVNLVPMIPAQENRARALNQALAQLTKILASTKFSLESAPLSPGSEEQGYYVERRRASIHLNLIGEVLEYNNKRVRLADMESRLLWALAVNRERPRFLAELGERLPGKKENIDIKIIAATTASLIDRLEELTGLTDIIVSGGNEIHGVWLKLKDATIRRIGAFPPSELQLDALTAFFEQHERDSLIQEITDKLNTGGRYHFSGGSAAYSLTRVVLRLGNRAKGNVLSEAEARVFQKIKDFIREKNLRNEKDLIDLIWEKLTKKAPQATPSPTMLAEESATAENEIGYLPESIEKPEFGSLSRLDIAVLASVIKIHQEEFAEILNQKELKPIEENILSQVIDLVGDELRTKMELMSEEEKRLFLNQARASAFEKALALIDNPQLGKLLDKIAAQNSNVYLLLVHLSEIKETLLPTSDSNGHLLDLLLRPPNKRVTVNTRDWTVVDVRPLEGTVTFVSTPLQPATEKRRDQLHQHDPKIEAHIEEHITRILARPDLQKPVNSAAVTRAFPTLVQGKIDRFVDGTVVKPTEDKGRNLFSPVDIAVMLYLNTHGGSLPSGSQRKVRDIAQRIFEQRIKGN